MFNFEANVGGGARGTRSGSTYPNGAAKSTYNKEEGKFQTRCGDGNNTTHLEISFKDTDTRYIVRLELHYQNLKRHHVMIDLDDVSFCEARKVS